MVTFLALPLHKHQVVLLGDRSRCAWAACPGPYSTA